MIAGFILLGTAVLLAAGHVLVRVVLRPGRLVSPSVGVAASLSLLSLRAAFSMAVAMLVFAYAGSGDHLSWIQATCVHLAAALPVAPWHPVLGEHAMGDIAGLVPAVLLTASAFLSIMRISKGHRDLARWLRRRRLGGGPSGSLIVRDGEMVLAAAGVVRPHVLVSPPTLLLLEDDELDAGLQHEFGHINRRHQMVSACGLVLRDISKALPGGQEAFDRLTYYLERDADEYAVRRTGSPGALARAICKLATSKSTDHGLALAAASRTGIHDRLDHLVHHRPSAVRDNLPLVAGTLAISGVAFALLAVAAGPVLAGGNIAPHLALAGSICG